ncbi:unnamed protein product [Caenorhabditis nigoni]
MPSPDENGPEKKASEPELATPAGPKPKAMCREKEEKSPAKQSDVSRMEKKGNINKSARRDARSARMKVMKPVSVKMDNGGSKMSIQEQLPKQQFNIQKPKDETDVACLQLEGELAQTVKTMEEYKVAMFQIHTILLTMIRRGNGTSDMENCKSEKGQAAAEKLNREVVQTENFWKSDTFLQPAMNQSIAKNSQILAAAERNLQEQAPGHMKKLKKFLHVHWPRYVEMKKELGKVVKLQKPDSQTVRAEYVKSISEFVKEKYLKVKNDHLGEIQSVLVELSFFHHASASAWHRIAERKLPKVGYQPETFDFKQFFGPPPKP